MTPADPLAAARAYEEGMVPALMAEWAPRLVAAAALGPGQRVLDVACGTGALTRAAAQAVGDSGAVTGLDLDPGMLAIAERRMPGMTWRQGSADRLPFPNGAFDAVVCQFGLMFFPDRPAALREMWRVLRPGGRLVVAVWASLEMTPAYALETRLIETRAGPAASAPLRVPFSLGEVEAFRSCFEAAGVPLTSLGTVTGTGRFPSIRAMLEADLVGWLPVMGVTLAPPVVAAILQEAESLFQPYVTGDGWVEFTSPAHVAVATRPAGHIHSEEGPCRTPSDFTAS